MNLRRNKSKQSLSSFFSHLFSTTAEETEGLYWLSIWPTDVSITGDTFQDILSRLVVPKILKNDEACAVWRLRNTSPSARGGTQYNGYKPEHGGPCALLARIPDLDMLWTSRTLQDLAGTNRPSGQSHVFGTQARTYQLVQRYEAKRGNRAKGHCLIAVHIYPAEGQEDDIDAWYRNEHLAMVAATPVILRSTRYVLRPNIVANTADDAPLLLTLHECTSAQELLNYAIQHGQLVEETPWSKRVFTTAKHTERTIWDITGKQHSADVKFDNL